MHDYVIVEWNQASRQPKLAFEDVYTDRDEAIELAREQMRRNRATGRREGFSVHQLDLSWSEWADDDPADPVSVLEEETRNDG